MSIFNVPFPYVLQCISVRSCGHVAMKFGRPLSLVLCQTFLVKDKEIDVMGTQRTSACWPNRLKMGHLERMANWILCILKC
jgi:hypothetical protein